jgi:hypothetical protein
VAVRIRSWLAAALGLWMAHPLIAAEPARLDFTPSQPLTAQAAPANQQIAQTIADHLRQSGQLRRYQIDISFQDGQAELTGRVTDPVQRDEALRIVQGVPGVERVRDRLVLTGQGTVAQTQAVAPVGPGVPGPTQFTGQGGGGGFVPPPPTPEGNGRNGNGRSVEPAPIFQPGPATANDLFPPRMPPYAWPTYAPYNNYSRVAYPELYPYKSWPFIGPCYPFPKVPLGWRSVKLKWEDGHWWYSKHATGHEWWRLRYW